MPKSLAWLSLAVAAAIAVAGLLLAVRLGRPPGRADTIAVETPPGSSGVPQLASSDLRIVTLLPFDGIRSIDNPEFVTSDGLHNYEPGELVLGVEISGDARAYSVPLLSSHEIVNDVVGGKPIAITW